MTIEAMIVGILRVWGGSVPTWRLLELLEICDSDEDHDTEGRLDDILFEMVDSRLVHMDYAWGKVCLGEAPERDDCLYHSDREYAEQFRCPDYEIAYL